MKFSSTSALIVLSPSSVNAFAPIHTTFTRNGYTGAAIANQNESMLNMAAQGKKKRRRRKQDPSSPETAPSPNSPTKEELVAELLPEGSAVASGENMPSIDELKSIASFNPPGSSSSSASSSKKRSIDLDAAVPSKNVSPVGAKADKDNTLVELPSIRNVLKNKELKKIEEEEEEKRARPKISRRDRKAMLQVSVF